MFKKFLLLTISLVFIFVAINHIPINNVSAQDNQQPAPITVDPPQLRDLEFAFVRFIYIAWAFGGIVFMLLLVYIGFLYLSGGADPNNVEIAKKRASMWVVGLIMYFLAWPITNTLMKALVNDQNNCYENLNTPGFTFFFPNVCTTPTSTPTPTPTPASTSPEAGTTTSTPRPTIAQQETICEQIINVGNFNPTCSVNCIDQADCRNIGNPNNEWVCSSSIYYADNNYTVECYCDDDTGIFDAYIKEDKLWPFAIAFAGGECIGFFPYDPFF